MSALLVSEVSRRRDYWRNTAVTPTKIQSSWQRIFVDRSYHTGPFLVGWSATLTLPDYGRVARYPGTSLRTRPRSHPDETELCRLFFRRFRTAHFSADRRT